MGTPLRRWRRASTRTSRRWVEHVDQARGLTTLQLAASSCFPTLLRELVVGGNDSTSGRFDPASLTVTPSAALASPSEDGERLPQAAQPCCDALLTCLAACRRHLLGKLGCGCMQRPEAWSCGVFPPPSKDIALAARCTRTGFTRVEDPLVFRRRLLLLTCGWADAHTRPGLHPATSQLVGLRPHASLATSRAVVSISRHRTEAEAFARPRHGARTSRCRHAEEAWFLKTSLRAVERLSPVPPPCTTDIRSACAGSFNPANS